MLYEFDNFRQSMEANCLVFPAPKNYNLDAVRNRIILIPRESNNKFHSLYCSQSNGEISVEQDEFSEWLTYCNEQKKMIKDSSLTNCDRKTTQENSLEGNLEIRQKVDSKQHIPCLFIPGTKKKLILFFHANGEDITTAYEFLKMVSFESKYPILAMEYQGYSIYEGATSPANIEADAARVIGFLQANRLTADQIIVFGRSIGCAVALTVTEKYNVHSAVLLSPFISLKRVASDLYCRCASHLIEEAFNNQENCKLISCPLLVIHGVKDTLVSYQHSLALIAGCQAYCRLKVIENMTHTKFNFRHDFVRHFKSFLLDLQ